MVRKFEKECEAVLDYMLPDYLGDIKRVMSVGAKCQNGTLFPLDDGAECSGSVNFEVIYLDVDGNLCEFNVPCDYECIFNIDMSKYRHGTLISNVIQNTHRVTSPRKMSLKAKILSALECDFSFSGECEFEGAECDVESISVYSSVYLEKKENEYSTELIIGEELLGDYDVLSSFGEVRIDSSEITGDSVKVSGEYIIGAIVKDENGSVFVIKKNVPFEEIITSESSTDADFAESYADVVSLNVSEDAESPNKLLVNFTSDIFVSLSKNEKIDIVRDAYYKNYKGSAEISSFESSSLVSLKESCECIECTFSPENLDTKDLRDVVAPAIQVQGLKCDCKEKEISVSGNFAISAVACEINEDGKRSYSPIKCQAPFSVSLPLEKEDDVSFAECRITPYDSEFTIEDSCIRAKILSNLTLKTFKNKSCDMVKSLERGEPKDKSESSVYTVVFPEQNETLFSLAKRYDTTREKLARDNSISSEALSSSDFVLPKRLIIT